jgi:tetratricopeptide (TPR) repeat protein
MISDTIRKKIEEQISTKKFDEAIKTLKNILKTEPDNVEILLDLGFVYGSVNRFKDATEIYQKVIKKVPNNETGYTGLGFIYKKQGEFEKASEQFKQALNFRIDNPMVYFELGEVLFDLEKYEEAILYLNKAIQFGGPENDVQTLILIAQCNLGLNTEKSIEEAIRIGHKVLEGDHQMIGAHLVLGSAYYLKKDWKAAIDNLERYISVEKEDDAALNLLKETQQMMKK